MPQKKGIISPSWCEKVVNIQPKSHKVIIGRTLEHLLPVQCPWNAFKINNSASDRWKGDKKGADKKQQLMPKITGSTY